MTPGRYDLVFYQGSRMDITLTWTDADDAAINLTGYTARLQVRRDKDATDVLLEMTTANGRIVLGGAAGTIQLVLGADVTATLDWSRVSAVYDLEMIPAGGEAYVVRLMEGRALLSKQVTRAA